MDGRLFIARNLERSRESLVKWVIRRWNLNPLEMRVIIDYFVNEVSPSMLARKYNVPKRWARSIIRMYKNRGGREIERVVRALAKQYTI